MENEKEFWEKYWTKEKRNFAKVEKFIFSEIIEKHIPELKEKNCEKEYFEVGCAPGNIMVFFNKVYGYQVSGCDFINCKIIEKNIKKAGVEQVQLYEEDFRKMDLDKKYNIVASYGFVEHFQNYSDILSKHKKLVAEDGYIIIELPNIRKFNYILYKVFAPELLNIHNLKVMDINVLRKEIEDNEFQIIYDNYYLSNIFMANRDNELINKKKVMKYIFLFIRKLFELLHCVNIPNKYFSPYIICIAKRKKGRE